MQKVLFVSFDLIRPRDPEKSLAIASILAALKSDERLNSRYEFEHLLVNRCAGENWREKIGAYKLGEYSFVAISVYAWSESIVNDVIKSLIDYGFNGRVILGGYQIAKDTLKNYKRRYPQADVFVEGYAEQALLDYFAEDSVAGVPMVIKSKSKLNPTVLRSPYLTGEIPVERGMEMLRIETKRGCPYRCSFCRHRDVVNNLTVELDESRVMEEFDRLISMNVKKINIIDPIFHIGNYMKILKKIVSLCKSKKAETLFSLQCRLEFLARGDGLDGREFLDLCGQGNFELEFGLQTCNERESILINRRNEMLLIEKALEILNRSDIRHEISLIYGLPGQTLESFSNGIEFLKKNRGTNCVVKAYPLMLLPGTPLYKEKEKYAFKEEMDDLNISHVVSSDSFTYNEWLKMKEIADTL